MSTPTPTLSAAGIQKLDELSNNAAKAGTLPPFVFGVTSASQELYFTAQGHLDYHDASSPAVTPDSIFWICSQTKLIASIAAHQLIERGVLSLTTPISLHIPAFAHAVVLQYPFKVASPAHAPLKPESAVQVQHLLNHSSGLFYSLTIPDPPYAMQAGYTSAQDEKDPLGGFLKTITGNFPGIPLKFEPGSNWTYGWNSDILGFLVEAVTGLKFDKYCQDNIFKPLNLRASFHLTPPLSADLVRLTFREADGKIVPWADQTAILEHKPDKVFAHLGGVGLYTSMRDYLTLLRHILQVKEGLPITDSRTAIIKQHTAESLFKPTLTPAGSRSLDRFNMVKSGLQFSTGLALTGEDAPGMRRKGSGWWAGWAGTSYFLDPTTGIAVVFGTQLVPPGEPEVTKLQEDLERAVYANLDFGLGNKGEEEVPVAKL
ncbi:beta-lactamase [Ephemerocybe angulata]|uniref:Beta-lactamase n=1 Tax=Ephemerocybe angulata TaxID=980116 RepID=A0A8H6M1B3_9AGAR|nr:beta-lactamase [Tulosesus angulatus]